MELLAHVQANMCSADQLIISCFYLLLTDQLKMNPYIIQFKLICGLCVTIIAYVYYIADICTIIECVVLCAANTEQQWDALASFTQFPRGDFVFAQYEMAL